MWGPGERSREGQDGQVELGWGVDKDRVQERSTHLNSRFVFSCSVSFAEVDWESSAVMKVDAGHFTLVVSWNRPNLDAAALLQAT